MKRYILCVAVLLVAKINVFSQETNVVEIPFDGTPVKKELTLTPSYGTGSPITVEVEFKRDVPSDAFSMTFKSSPRHEGKFLYFFGGAYQMKTIQKAYSMIRFDKKVGKQKVVEKYYGDIDVENISPRSSVQCFKMDSADFTITFNQSGWNGSLCAYVAVKNKNIRQVFYSAKLPLNISMMDPCAENIVKSKMEKIQNLVNEISQINAETDELKKISCVEYKSASFEPKDPTIDNGCPACKYCSDYTALANNFSPAITEYAEAVKEYNAVLADVAKKYAKPCADPCACNCTKFKEVRENVGSLLWDLQLDKITKAKAKEEFTKIQNSLPCGAKCKDCETKCKTCPTYAAYKKDCDTLKKMLK